MPCCRSYPFILIVFVVGATVFSAEPDSTPPHFGRDVRPILARHCFTCHGPDPAARESGLRLDVAADATADLGGYQAVVPGDPAASEMIVRVSSDDSDVRMPPAESHPPLTQADIDTLRGWILSGARYETHWAFLPPCRPSVPTENSDGCRNEIDHFILRALRQADLKPSPQADRERLVRRLYLDLAGVTPAPEEVARFVEDTDPNAYGRVVDDLLASPEYAERFARPWLDLARYSDTNGYEKDRPRTIWPFRDWVIRAIAADMRFDQFSIEQLAGDMLPAATREQQIATGFHRNTMINEEGGIDPNEYRFYAMVDRVATTGTVWMGLTTGCAQCHTHKYDPITHTDYYSLFALLNNADEPDVLVADAVAEANAREINQQIRREVDRLARELLPASQQDIVHEQVPDNVIHQAFDQWLKLQREQARDWQTIRPDSMKSTMPKLRVLDDDSILASGDVTKREVYDLGFELDGGHGVATALRLEVLPHDSLPAGGPGMAYYEGRRGDFFLSELSVKFRGKPIPLNDASHSFGKISVGSGSADAANVIDGDGSSGWSTSAQEGEANRLVVNFAQPVSGPGKLEVQLLFERHFAAALGRFRLALAAGDSPAVAMSLPPGLDAPFSRLAVGGTISDDLYGQLQRHFVRFAPELKQQRHEIDRLQAMLPEPVRTLGMRQRPPDDHRVTHRHHRGEYLKSEEQVGPAVPALFQQLDQAKPADRLALAEWLVSENNPLVARVAVNRAWRQFFGTGIVRTAGDFGTQSEPPSHPELIDWLASEIRHGGWSMKRLHRLIVMSSTYRQAVGVAPEQDPDNRLLSCFPHRRFDAEQIRDAMLSAAGLLARRVGGPSVYPPQPESVSQMAYGSPKWQTSQGADRYRRSLYTFSKRTAPFAAYATFDGPSGEFCVARRDESTTPLQALTLMNDPMYLEIAQALADTSLRHCGQQASERQIATDIFRRLLVRAPEPAELDSIVAFYRRQAKREQPWALVARALMNTDEAITIP